MLNLKSEVLVDDLLGYYTFGCYLKVASTSLRLS